MSAASELVDLNALNLLEKQEKDLYSILLDSQTLSVGTLDGDET